MNITKRIQRCAEQFLAELDASWLEVCKIRKEDCWVRVAICRNTDWYRCFCRTFMRARRRYRKPRTIIKRGLVRNALLHILDGRCETIYAGRLVEFMRHWMDNHRLPSYQPTATSACDEPDF